MVPLYLYHVSIFCDLWFLECCFQMPADRICIPSFWSLALPAQIYCNNNKKRLIFVYLRNDPM